MPELEFIILTLYDQKINLVLIFLKNKQARCVFIHAFKPTSHINIKVLYFHMANNAQIEECSSFFSSEKLSFPQSNSLIFIT